MSPITCALLVVADYNLRTAERFGSPESIERARKELDDLNRMSRWEGWAMYAAFAAFGVGMVALIGLCIWEALR